jgi:hypothetical protein
MRLLLIPVLLLFTASAAHTQSLSARGPDGAAVAIETSQGEKGVQLTIAIGDGEPQVFDGIGDALVALRAGNRSGPVLAFDVDRDGIDEIFVRTSLQGQRGLLLVFRWDAAANQYAPVSFTQDTGAPKSYLFVHLSQPVSVNGNVIEANHDSADSGRMRLRVFRYRWNGQGFAQTTDH